MAVTYEELEQALVKLEEVMDEHRTFIQSHKLSNPANKQKGDAIADKLREASKAYHETLKRYYAS